eukprot:10730318-Ditylum_brightwellii.AAC.1
MLSSTQIVTDGRRQMSSSKKYPVEGKVVLITGANRVRFRLAAHVFVLLCVMAHCIFLAFLAIIQGRRKSLGGSILATWSSQ